MSEPAIDASLARAILLKVGFKPDLIRRAQAFLLFVALEGGSFTADCLPSEVSNDQTTAGCAVRTLAAMQLIEMCGRCKSPSKSRHGAEVKMWRLATGRRGTVEAWLKQNGFEVGQRQMDLMPG